jgi:hypothetical protein
LPARQNHWSLLHHVNQAAQKALALSYLKVALGEVTAWADQALLV